MTTPKKSPIWDKDLYGLLGVTSTATESEIKKAYRKSALKCHPDKNPDDPKAAALFIELSSALEILTDAKAKEAYDRTLKAKQLAAERTAVLDVKRRKLKEDLERREKEAQAARKTTIYTPTPSESQKTDEDLLRKEVERLKKEGSAALREEQEIIRQQLLKEQKDKVSFIQETYHYSEEQDEGGNSRAKFKIKWSPSVLIDESKLRNILSRYGKIANLVVIKRTALVEFENEEDAVKAFESEEGKTEYQWKFQWIRPKNEKNGTMEEDPRSSSNSTTPPPAPPPKMAPAIPRLSSVPPTPTSFADLEAMILGQLANAAKAQAESTSGSNSDSSMKRKPYS